MLTADMPRHRSSSDQQSPYPPLEHAPKPPRRTTAAAFGLGVMLSAQRAIELERNFYRPCGKYFSNASVVAKRRWSLAGRPRPPIGHTVC